MDICELVNLTHRAWTIAILANMHAGVPGRQAPLLKATGANRSACAKSIEHLIDLGLVERNPGYGHPLRPEFRLAPKGAPVARLAAQVQDAPGTRDHDLLRKAWTLPVLATLQRPARFTDIKRKLVPITDRALSQSLILLENRKWVTRQVDATARPPRPSYHAINAGKVISQIVALPT